MTVQDLTLSRRSFIASAALGGFALGFHLPEGGKYALAQPAQGAEVNSWIVIGKDDSVTIRIHRSEIGQGAFTVVPQMVAEELECDWSKVRPEFASPNTHIRRNKVYVTLSTGGSQNVRSSHLYLRKAGAAAREMLIQAAAQDWGVPAAECKAENSKITHTPSNRSVTYGQVAEKAAKLTPPADPKIKPWQEWKVIGQSKPRFDLPSKVDGSAIFGMDIRLPDMLIGAVVQSPVFGGKVKSFDEAAIKDRKGYRGIVPLPNGLIVVADTFWQAKTAMEALPIEWNEGENAKVSSETIHERLKAGLADKGASARRVGNPEEALAKAAKVIEADYGAPFLDHASMEPINCTAKVTGDKVEVWCSTQNGEAALAAAAETAGVPPLNVEVYRQMAGGGFGRRGQQEYVRQAVTAAMKFPGRPIKIIWTREEDIRHGYYRPISISRLKAGFDASGNLVAYDQKVVGQSIFAHLLPHLIQNGIDRTSVDGTMQNQAYGIPNVNVDYVMRNTHVPVGFWRAVGATQNAFITESFVDELAHAAGKDPYQFRRDLLKHNPRWTACLDLAAEKAGWGKPLPAGQHRGIAINESFGSICAHVVEASVDAKGKVTVHRVVTAIDCAFVVNPDNAVSQMESCVIYGLTAALNGEITIKDGRVEQGNFDDYEMMRMDETPKIEAYFSLSRAEVWGGIGEPGLPPVMPALCNAIFAATGKRIRSLPIKNHDLSKA
jgi:isoquinoline 1-oxidoreductase beta subunit